MHELDAYNCHGLQNNGIKAYSKPVWAWHLSPSPKRGICVTIKSKVYYNIFSPFVVAITVSSA